MPDDINDDFLVDSESAVDEVLESLEDSENVADEQNFEVSFENDLLSESIEGGEVSETQPELVGSDDPSGSVASDAYGIYSNFDIPVVGIHSASSAEVQAVVGSEVISNDNIYSVSINNRSFDIYVPSDLLDTLAVCNGVLYNMGAETVTCAVLNSDRTAFSDDTLVILLPVSSTNGITSNLRYGSYSYYREYTPSGNYGGYTSDDYYGSCLVVEEPPLFSGKPLVAYVFFAFFAVLGFYCLKKIFRRREV